MKIENKINITELFTAFILFVGILPVTSIFGFTVPWQYMFMPIFTFAFLLICLGYIKVPAIGKYLIVIWMIIIFEVLFSATFNPMLKLNSFSFPNEALQYIMRFLIFIYFIALFYNWDLNPVRFMKTFLGVLLLGMVVGLLQFFELPVSSFFRSAYTYSDRNLEFMMRDNIVTRRVGGVAHHATSNGGISAFTLTVIISMYLFHKKQIFLTLLGIFLVIINIVGSQARMGYVTIAFSVIVFYFVYNYIYKKGIKSTIYIGVIISIVGGVIYWLYSKGNGIVVQAVGRWASLGEQVSQGGNRVGQVIEGMSLLQNPFDYLFGVSKEVERILGGTFIEVEPINIFILYGLLGFILQYGLILILLIYLYKSIANVKQNPILLSMVVASFIGLLGYQVFSLAYYFFREIHIGLFPWILLGVTIGTVERYKKFPDQFKKFEV